MFDLSIEERKKLWDQMSLALEDYYQNTNKLDVTPRLDQSEIVSFIKDFDTESNSNESVLNHVLEGLSKYAVHTPHQMYYGLFNPRSSFAGIMADTITAFFNPQLAAWSHSPFAVEVERYLVELFGEKFGYAKPDIDGSFTSGGAEANLTAILCAANHRYPKLKEDGWQNVVAKPLIYCSEDGHHSVQKSAKMIGLGSQSVISIPIDENLIMNVNLLEKRIVQDMENGFDAMIVIGTLGYTGTGEIDDISAIYKLKNKYGFWLHADAAFGGAVGISKRYQKLTNGIENADSITFDAHKWLSLPMGAGMFITKHPKILKESFGISTEYMPKDASGLDIVDPFSHTVQWSRRFIGLKMYMSVLLYGWEGLEQLVDNQIEMGKYLKSGLENAGWKIYNNTELPVICFGKDKLSNEETNALCQSVISTGQTWISVYKIKQKSTLRACITNYNTSKQDIVKLIGILNQQSK